jgi:hypothetical protein
VVTEQVLRELLKSEGWGLVLRARRSTGKRYAYARRRDGNKFLQRYIGPESDFTVLTPETVQAKVNRPS